MLGWEQREAVMVGDLQLTFTSTAGESPCAIRGQSQGPVPGRPWEEECSPMLRRAVYHRSGRELPDWFQVGSGWTFIWDRRTGFQHRLGAWSKAPSELRRYHPIALSAFQVKTKPEREWRPGGHVKVVSLAPPVFFLELRAAEGLSLNLPLQARPACWW